ncbi:MAG TPA: hypothetical protein VJ867_06345 [Gemmatimonadaceae bacterium]|nr:hypothetical protein [Gemmatimonadaceae bacterium]
MRRVWLAILPCLATIQLQAQSGNAARCPVVDGITASVSTDDSSRAGAPAPPAAPVPRLDARTAIDTTWSFNVTERTWSWPTLAASVGVGLSGGSAASRSGGMTTAPDSSAARAWSICAAASVGMRNSTLTLRGARGTVHLRADVSALQRAGRTTQDSTVRPRR